MRKFYDYSKAIFCGSDNDTPFGNTISNNILEHEVFELCDFSDAIFENSYITASFYNCVFMRATFSNCTFDSTFIHSCDLGGAVFDNCTFKDFHMLKCNACGMDFTKSCVFDLSTTIDFDKTIIYNDSIKSVPLACPKKGSFDCWKTVRDVFEGQTYLIHLVIPKGAYRSSAFSNKCRASEAEVAAVYKCNNRRGIEGNYVCEIGEEVDEVVNQRYDHIAIYRRGEIVKPDGFDACRWHECSNGIHFFMTPREALDYAGYKHFVMEGNIKVNLEEGAK